MSKYLKYKIKYLENASSQKAGAEAPHAPAEAPHAPAEAPHAPAEAPHAPADYYDAGDHFTHFDHLTEEPEDVDCYSNIEELTKHLAEVEDFNEICDELRKCIRFRIAIYDGQVEEYNIQLEDLNHYYIQARDLSNEINMLQTDIANETDNTQRNALREDREHLQHILQQVNNSIDLYEKTVTENRRFRSEMSTILDRLIDLYDLYCSGRQKA